MASTVVASEKERSLLVELLIEDVKDKNTIAAFATWQQSYDQFYYSMMGQGSYFTGAFGRVMGQLTNFPANFLIHRELRPLAGAATVAKAVVRAALGGGAPPRKPPTTYVPKFREPEPRGPFERFLSRGGARHHDRHAAAVFFRMHLIAGLLLFLSSQLGLNLMVFGVPTLFILWMWMLKELAGGNDQVAALFESAFSPRDWTPGSNFAARKGTLTADQAYNMTWRGQVWGLTRGMGFIGPTYSMILDAPDRGVADTVLEVLRRTFGTNMVQWQRTIQINYGDMERVFGAVATRRIAIAMGVRSYYRGLSSKEKAEAHTRTLPPSRLDQARVPIHEPKAGRSTHQVPHQAPSLGFQGTSPL